MSKRKRQLICIALGILVGALCLGLGQLPAFKTLEGQTLDLRFRLRPNKFPDSPVVVVLIDDETLKFFGKSLLDDEDYEILTQRLIELGARTVAFDTPFMERLRPEMVKSVRGGDGTHLFYPVRFVLKPGEEGISEARYIIAPYTDLYKNALSLGHTNLFPDPDGILRRLKTSINFEGRSYLFLPLLAVSDYLGCNKMMDSIPAIADDEGNLLVNYYRDTRNLKETSAIQFLNQKSRQDYEGKIVLVGRRTSYFPDTISTPIGDDYSLTKIYATSMANILHRDFLRFPAALILALIILLLGGLMGYVVGALRPLWAFVFFLIILCLYLGVTFFGFMLNLVMEVLSPGLTIIFSYLSTTILRDSLEERLLSASLTRARLYHGSVIESMTSGLIVIDMGGRVVTLNERAKAVLGIREEVGGLPYQELLEEGRLREILEEAFLEWRGTKGEEITFKGRRLVTSGTVLRDERGEAIGAMVIFHDVSEIRRLQEEVKLKERLAAVGELAAGVAHEFRNPLGSIASSAKLLASELKSENKYLDVIVRETDVLGGLIEEFLYFSRPAKLNLLRMNVNSLLEDSLSFLMIDAGKTDITVEKDLGEIPVLSIDPFQIKRAFINLIQNSLEAMQEGQKAEDRGQGTEDRRQRAEGRRQGIEAREKKLRVKSEELRVEEERFVKISIEDTGPGIKEDDLPRIFDPFFTTRPEGTGLGLAIVHKIIENHKGRIECQSRVGEGTTFSIYLPVDQMN